MTINIKGKDYKVKYTLRALFIFEQITGKPFEIKTLLDNYVFYYSLIFANNPDDVLDWDEFIDALDEDPKLLAAFSTFMLQQEKKNNIIDPDDKDLKSNSKKKSRSKK